nr:MAG TPA: hypothetical protein [Caudoviricetes sp.]
MDFQPRDAATPAGNGPWNLLRFHYPSSSVCGAYTRQRR